MAEAEWETDSSSNDESSSDLHSRTGEPPPKSCNACSKLEASSEEPLKRCGRCQDVRYCSTDCQKSDWPSHKSNCKKPDSTSSGGLSNVAALLEGLTGGIDLHKLSEKDCFTQLIDSYRLRIEDDYNFHGDTCGLYGGHSPRKDFTRFLVKAEKRKGLLPRWWSESKKEDCINFGMTSDWPCLKAAVEKSDIVEHYGDRTMPMKLRIVAEKVTGQPVQR